MPLKFEIYRDGTRLTTFAPTAAIVIGPESVPMPGEVSFRDGMLVVHRADTQAAAVGLLWDAGSQGQYHLETTRLPPRPEPYNLNLELARMRLMKIVQKLEDWNLFDFPRIEKYTQRFKDAQMLFADALGYKDDPAAAARLADQSLAISLDLSEQLAAFHCELLINRRRAGNGFARHVFGCRVNPAIQNQKYREMLINNFDYAVMPMSWKQLQPQEGEFETTEVDHWVETLALKRTPIIAGPLVSFDGPDTPAWLYVWENDFDTIRELTYQYVQKVVHRYRKAVAAWNVVAGLHTNIAFAFTFEQIIELTRLVVAQIKNMLPNSRVLITVSHPFGEYAAKAKSGVPPMLYAEMVAQAGINFEAFAVELELGVPEPGHFMRDLFQISSMLDRFATLGRPVSLTAVSAPGRANPDPGDRSEGRLDPSAAGRWHRPWDPQLQAEWLEAVYRIAMSKPFIESIAWGSLADISPALAGGGLLDDMLQPKPAFTRLQAMREQFHSWSTKKA